MPRPRFQKIEADKQRRIIEAAGREFAEHGFDGASLNQVVAEAGISKGALYYYFDDKEDLFATVMESIWERLSEAADFRPESVTAETFWDRYLDLGRAAVAAAESTPWVIGISRAWYALPYERRREGRLAVLHKMWSTFGRAMLERGQALGTVRNDLPVELLSEVLLALDQAIDQWMLAHWGEFDHAALSDWSQTYIGIVRRIVSPGAEKDSQC